MKKPLTLIAAVLLTGSVAFTQNPGDLDINFGISGYTLNDPLLNTGEVYMNTITLSDDKIIMVGYSDGAGNQNVLVSKFLADGASDLTFGASGTVSIDLSLGQDEKAYDVYELSNGKLLITGWVQTPTSFDGFIMRLNSDGSVDASFGTSSGHTKFNTGDNTTATGRQIVVSGNDIFVASAAIAGGSWYGHVVKFTQGGGINVSFASSGFASLGLTDSNYPYTMDMNSNGEFFIGGTININGVINGFVTKLSSFGTPTSFAGTGTYSFDFGGGFNELRDLFVDANEKIVLAASDGVIPNIDGYIVRLNTNGTIDSAFANNGIATSDPGLTTSLIFRRVMEDPNGGIIASGHRISVTTNEIYAMFLNSDGSLNTAFGGNGDVNIPFTITLNSILTTGAALQSDGGIIIGGFITSQDFVGENMYLIRLNPDNLSVDDIISNNLIVYPNPIVAEFKIEVKNTVQLVQLISLQGEEIASWQERSIYTLPPNVTPGVYLLNVKTEKANNVTKIIIQ